MSNAHVWRAAQDRLRHQMTRAQFETWLRGTWLDADPADEGATVLRVRTTFAKELLETRFRERIEAAVAEVTGKPCRLLVAVANGEPEADAEPVEPVAATRTHASVAARVARHAASGQAGAPSLFAAVEETSSQPPAAMAARAGEGGTIRRVPPLSAPRRRAVSAAATPTSPMRPAPGLPRTKAALPARSAASDVPPMGVGTDPTSGEQASTEGAVPARIERMERLGGPHGDVRPEAPHTGVRAAQEEQRPLPPLAADEGAGLGGLRGVHLTPPKLNPRYTFSTFIVGSGNQLAHAASQAVAEAPGQAYNPLFLYGGVGLGKTHLLHAIGHTAIDEGLAVLYVSSETFTNEIINAIRFRTTEEFRAKYRSVDVLLVDDIQFIAGKDSTEEEFFHTFNALYENNKQIVVCSDRPPKAIVSLAERLRSRFEWGLIADIQPPDLETRVAILRAKSDSMGRRVPDEVLTYLANRVQSNIRELEGSFNRLFAVAQLQGLPLTIETAKAALANLASDSQQRRVSVAAVLDAVAEYYRIPPDDLRGKQRDKHIVGPRQVAMYLMREETEASLLEVGQALGGRDHSTVLHGVEKIARELNDNTTLRKDVSAIRQQLLG